MAEGEQRRAELPDRHRHQHVLSAARECERGFDQTGEGDAVIPLLCSEVCNVLVAAARPKVKNEIPPKQ